jgi:hypothetical protein
MSYNEADTRAKLIDPAIHKRGNVHGLLSSLGLIAVSTPDHPSLLLTEAGWSFASLANPVLDGLQESPREKLSTAEQVFLSEHIRKNVPRESSAYDVVLAAVEQGYNNPTQLDRYLIQLYEIDVSDKNSGGYVTTARADVISRLADLGLLQRIREGITFSYRVTKRGSDFTATRRPDGDHK